MRLISVDDTMIATLLQRGMVTAAAAVTHPMRNVLTQSAGAQENVEAHISERDLQPGDTLLLCSDGLHGVVKSEAIQEILESRESAESVVNRLIEAAIAGGSPDNISAVVLRPS
jgi:protein phosphatase